jgi:hypothetical protein
MNTNFTPGPWTVLEVHGEIFVAAEPIEGHPYFNRTRTTEIMSDEDYPRKDADAALISAAPDLYKALDNMLNIDAGHNEIIAASIALAKARGEKV